MFGIHGVNYSNVPLPPDGTPKPLASSLPPSAPSLGAQPPATEQTLTEGGAVYVTNTSPPLYIPISNPLNGAPGTTCSEAWGYYMRSAVEAGDEPTFKKLVSSYYYFCNIASPPTFLMGWNPSYINFTSPYATQGSMGSATDADEDILSAMMMASQKFTDLQNWTVSSPYPASSISFPQLVINAAQAFMTKDISSSGTIGDGSQDPNDPSGFYLDYFDPQFFVDLYNFCASNGAPQDFVTNIATVAENTMNAIATIVENNGGGVPQQSNDGNTPPSAFGAEQSRILMRLGEFILNTGNQTNPMYAGALVTLQRIVGALVGVASFNSGNYTIPSLSGAAFTGPMYLAVTALIKTNNIPPKLLIPMWFELCSSRQKDLSTYDNSTPAAWQNSYFNTSLGILTSLIVNRLAPASGPLSDQIQGLELWLSTTTPGSATNKLVTDLLSFLQSPPANGWDASSLQLYGLFLQNGDVTNSSLVADLKNVDPNTLSIFNLLMGLPPANPLISSWSDAKNFVTDLSAIQSTLSAGVQSQISDFEKAIDTLSAQAPQPDISAVAYMLLLSNFPQTSPWSSLTHTWAPDAPGCLALLNGLSAAVAYCYGEGADQTLLQNLASAVEQANSMGGQFMANLSDLLQTLENTPAFKQAPAALQQIIYSFG